MIETQKGNGMALFTLRDWPTSIAEPLFNRACCVISKIAKPICLLAVRMLLFKTWRLKDIAFMLIVNLEQRQLDDFGGNNIFTGFGVKPGWLNKVWFCWHM